MALECRRRMSVTVKTETVESGLDAFFEIRSAAAMARNTPLEATSISVVVVAFQAIDGKVLAVREVEGNGICTTEERLTQRSDCGASQKAGESYADDHHDAQYQRRMPPEHEPVSPRCTAGRIAWSAEPQQHKHRANRSRQEQGPTQDATYISVRRDDVHGN